MPYSTIDKPNKYFNTILYTGTGSSLANTGVGFQPDWTWIKARSTTGGHRVYDVIRGATDTLYTNQTYESAVEAQTLTSFNSDGFTVGTDSGVNGSGVTFVAWNWDANGTGVSNTSGTISSTVSANTTSGFSIVSWTGTGTTGTVGHSLGVAPSFYIVKRRNADGFDWFCYHKSLGATKFILLDTTGAEQTSDLWNDTSPTSTVFNVKTQGSVNASGGTYIAYCFADVKGFSKFGSRTGNGSLDGDFVYTGFKPALVITKRSDGVDNWRLHDNKRNTFNVVNNQLLADSSNSENTNTFIDFLSNGFKYRLDGGINTSSGKYIYMAFAENPFVSSKGIPTTAR
jgi:hypothetical protein